MFFFLGKRWANSCTSLVGCQQQLWGPERERQKDVISGDCGLLQTCSLFPWQHLTFLWLDSVSQFRNSCFIFFESRFELHFCCFVFQLRHLFQESTEFYLAVNKSAHWSSFTTLLCKHLYHHHRFTPFILIFQMVLFYSAFSSNWSVSKDNLSIPLLSVETCFYFFILLSVLFCLHGTMLLTRSIDILCQSLKLLPGLLFRLWRLTPLSSLPSVMPTLEKERKCCLL